ncbi:hypothetical protein OIU74_001748, partial [Salix koriyanagi]
MILLQICIKIFSRYLFTTAPSTSTSTSHVPFQNPPPPPLPNPPPPPLPNPPPPPRSLPNAPPLPRP